MDEFEDYERHEENQDIIRAGADLMGCAAAVLLMTILLCSLTAIVVVYG